ncbi:MAG: hypothetical protein WBW11_13590 [Pseudolabrys sp.]
MYALITVIGVLSSGSSVIPVGVTSQLVGKFKTLDDCKAAANQPHAGGTIPDFNFSTTWGVNWYCTYTGANRLD